MARPKRSVLRQRRRNKERQQREQRVRSRSGLVEKLEPRLLLTNGPKVDAFAPASSTNALVRDLRFDLSEPVVAEDANDAATYALIDTGADQTPGGPDDWTITVRPNYDQAAQQVTLEPDPTQVVSLARFQEYDYRGDGGAGTWSVGENEVAFSGGSASFFVSPSEVVDRPVRQRVQVNTNNDNDFVGFTFGFNPDQETNRPQNYYAVTWKQQSQSGAEEGLKLLRVADTGELSESVAQALLWDGEDGEHITVLDSSLSSTAGWADRTEYEMQLTHSSTGRIQLDIVQVSDGTSLWQVDLIDPAPLTPGRVGFFNYSQGATSYQMHSDTLLDGVYQLTVTSGDPGLRDIEGNALDGNADGTDGDDFVASFLVDREAPRVTAFSASPTDLSLSITETYGVSAAITSSSSYQLIDSGGDGILGNGNDIDRTARLTNIEFDAATGVAKFTVSPALEDELYQFTAKANAITDQAGNPLHGGTDFVRTVLPVDPTVAIDLTTASDTGASDTDDITSDQTPTLAVTVNKQGTIDFDFDGDGTFDASQSTSSTVEFTPGTSEDGIYEMEALFTPIIGPPVSTTLVVTVDTQPPTVADSAGGSLRLDGIDDFVALPPMAAANSLPLTLEAWVKPELETRSVDDSNNIISNNIENQAGHGFGIVARPNRATLTVSRHNEFRRLTQTGIQSDQWYHIATVYTEGNVKTYLNGQLVDDHSYDQETLDGADQFTVGRQRESNPGDRFFLGEVDDVRVWSVARTAEEIHTNFNRPLAGSEAGLAGYWRFNETTGEAVVDASGNGHDGQLGGGLSDAQPAREPHSNAGIGVFGRPDGIRVVYSDLGGIDPTTATDASNYAVVSSGGDGTLDDGNEVDLSASITTVDYDQATRTAIVRFDRPLNADAYRVTASGSSTIKDLVNLALNGGMDTTTDIVIQTVPPEITVDLQDESDTGVLDTDDLTNDVTPTFDVTVSEPGTINIDFDGDGLTDETRLVAHSGTYDFTAPALAHGEYLVQASLDSATGESAAGVLPINLDTRGPQFFPARAGTALVFDGNDQVTSERRHWGFSTTATISAWIKTTDDLATIFSLAHDVLQDELLLTIIGGTVGIYNHKSANNFVARHSDSLVNTGEWVHVAGVIEGSGSENLRIFVNGVEEVGTVRSSGNPVDIVDEIPRAVTLGARDQWGEHFLGEIDEVRLWNQPRTEQQIATDMHRRLNGDDVGLVSYWRMDDVQNEVIADSSRFSADLILNSEGPTTEPAVTESTAPIRGVVPTVEAPLYQRQFVSSEPIDPSTVTPDQFSLVSPAQSTITVASATVDSARSVNVNFGPRVTAGTYTLTIATGIRDAAGNPLDQDEDGTNAEVGQDEARDVFTATADTDGPRVARIDPPTQAGGEFDSVGVTFDEPIRAESFTAADITIMTPTGLIVPANDMTVTAVSKEVEPGVEVVQEIEVTFHASTDAGHLSSSRRAGCGRLER